MVDVMKACALATQAYGMPYIRSVTDIGHSFVIDVTDGADNVPDVSGPPMVDKETGKVNVCFIPQYFQELNKGIKVEIPTEYRMP